MMCVKQGSFGRGGLTGQKRAGVALVIILSVVVFVSILVAVFLTTTALNRQLSFSSAGQVRAEHIATVGLDTTISDLRSEIAAGSSASSVLPVIYTPTTNTTVVPSRVGDQGIINLVKRSVAGEPFWPQEPPYAPAWEPPTRAASGNSTTNAAMNGRFILPERWNDTFLLGSGTATLQPPDWVLVTRQGAMTNAAAVPALSVLSDAKPGNEQYVIGRYAYMIYDQGGLLDINVAGFPSGVSAAFQSRRGLLAQVDLSKIPGVKDSSALVAWRNPATRTTYETNVFSNTNGFTETAPNDRTFVSRQDLINYVLKHPAEIESAALQYLGTFNRSLNAPSYVPSAIRRKVGAQDDTINPSIVNTRVTKTFTRTSDGQETVVGEPLLKYRFPLSRLALFSNPGTNAGKIQEFFGLTGGGPGTPWIYRNGATEILTLDKVAAEGREPDFFELLQAGMLHGSLGSIFPADGSQTTTADADPDLQIMQVGANLIDQYDADSYPTALQYASTDLSGVENLPYLSRVFETIYWPGGDAPVGVWYQAEVWSPHAKVNLLAPNSPSNFRFRVRGRAGAHITAGAGGANPYDIPVRDFASSDGITFPATGVNIDRPLVLSQATGATASPEDTIGTQRGVNIGTVPIPLSDLLPPKTGTLFKSKPDPLVSFELQYLDATGNYVTYDRMRNINDGVEIYYVGDQISTMRPTEAFFIRSDPRSDRFGVTVGDEAPAQGATVRADASNGYSYRRGTFIGLFSENLPGAATFYADPDGEVRPADGAYGLPALKAGYPLMTANRPSRPFVLNRPFRSVGEMGYASRGAPWKHLDFFHASSGDAGLLDLFCVNEPAKATDSETVVEAGRLSLNTRQAPVLAAALSGALRTEDDSSVLTDADAAGFADNLLALTTTGGQFLLNRSDLVTRWMPALPATTADTAIKRRRESVIRALADIGDTRTWNLLIDIVAQSGRYNMTAKNLNQFVVEGERRYWLHVAIDRYTGKVIARQLESVKE